MQKYKQAAISIAFLTIMFSAGIYTGYGNKRLENDNRNQLREVAILNSFEDNDYEAWKRNIGKNNDVSDIISKEEFELFIQARSAVRGGDYDKAIALSQKLENDLKAKMGEMYLS
jgi:hypothetical protein